MYSFLDPHKQGAKLAAYIVGIAIAEIVLFIIIRYICILRNYLVAKFTKPDMQRVDIEDGTGERYYGSLDDLDIDSAGQRWEDVSRTSISKIHLGMI